ncbi:bark storage protein A-like protein [Carex littledalei]|uniref:Bark storage protein A-like protein n=1 Tax=Carex littledalei TaxID=544730 RepID=A0A833VI66_9POAL|nr:bark storage protein A-like protein [Carex littledalei]
MEIKIQRLPLLILFFSVLCFDPTSGRTLSVDPVYSSLDQVNTGRPLIGLVMSYITEAEAVGSSGEFVPSSKIPFVDLYGRRFHIGSIRNVSVVYVLTGQRRLNAGITVQILLDRFKVDGIVHYGTAGSANNSMSFGDVSVPKYVAFTGSWTWTKFNSDLKNDDSSSVLTFGEYNVPNGGENLLSGVKFKTEEFYAVGKSMEEVFWLEINSNWLQIAQNLKVKLERCSNESYCLPTTPKLVTGLRASTADIFCDNAAYRQFLFEKFGVSTVDEESSAIVMTAMSPGVPVIVFRGVSDLAGGEATWSSTSLMDLASINALKAAIEFIGVLGKQKSLVYT